jgi:large subunit ribosomal protein L32
MVPKRKTSKARKRKRRSHHALTPRGTVICSHCNQVTLPHRVCPNCGWYQNRQVVEVEES